MAILGRLKAFVFGLVIGGAATWVGAARAESVCSEPGPDGGQQCTAGVRSTALDQTMGEVGGQRASQWCWAASIAMVLRHHGFVVSQERIVRETFGELVDMPGSTWQILAALQRTWTDDRGRRFQVTADMITGAPEVAIAELAADRPLIVGTMGHAMVLTALGYGTGGWSGGGVTSAVVRDPWPGRGRRELSGQEWYGADLLVRIHVRPLDAAAPARSFEPAAPERYDEGASFDPGAFEDVDLEAVWLELLSYLEAE